MALANENSFAIDPNELQSDEQIDHDINHAARPDNILDPGFNLTLRPMKYQVFFDMYKDAIKNTWTVDEIDFSDDHVDLRNMQASEKHLISCLLYTSDAADE